MLEKECSAQVVYDQIKSLLADQGKQKAMRIALQKLAVLDSADRICRILEQLAAKKRN
jgi:UDP-N-acetylglucosamine:LPS N-acetylglucosamine transferase